jgi:hypothetical protein
MEEERTRRDDLARLIRALLEAVEEGEIEALTPQAQRLLRRLEGALATTERLHQPEV